MIIIFINLCLISSTIYSIEPITTSVITGVVAKFGGASLFLHIGKYNGNAIAVTKRKALTALHGHGKVNDVVTLVNSHGTELKGKVCFCRYELNKVDMAVIVLDGGVPDFTVHVPICVTRVVHGQKLLVLGKVYMDELLEDFVTEAQVMVIGSESTLFRSSYQCDSGLSGAGIMVVPNKSGECHVVGVHVGANDDTVEAPPIKKMKSGAADADSVSSHTNSLAHSLHGHTAYCLICEAVRVDGLMDELNKSV